MLFNNNISLKLLVTKIQIFSVLKIPIKESVIMREYIIFVMIPILMCTENKSETDFPTSGTNN